MSGGAALRAIFEVGGVGPSAKLSHHEIISIRENYLFTFTLSIDFFLLLRHTDTPTKHFDRMTASMVGSLRAAIFAGKKSDWNFESG